jgi:AcrR family transcriptional regulator
MAAALELFAKHGFRRTTVGDIEAAAGLTARGGALYKHFRNKEELLEEAVAARIDQIKEMRAELLSLLPLDDVRSEAMLLSRWVLTELEREREIQAILEKEGDAFPELRDRFFEEIIEPGHQAMSAHISHRFAPAIGLDGVDADALAVIAGGALINYRLTRWTFGRSPMGVEEERVVAELLRLLMGEAPG